MPELPDVELYISLLRERLVGRRLNSLKIYNPFVLRSVVPPPKDLEGRTVVDLRRLGKRIVIGFEDDYFLIVHLMIAGRFRWADGPTDARLGGKISVAALTFENGTLYLTEAGSKKRASLAVVRGDSALAAHDPGGLDVLTCSLEDFTDVLRRENHSIKDTLTNPHLLSGVGNAYSDEILHAAQISPHRLTKSLTDEEIERLHTQTSQVLRVWTERLKKQFAGKFPGAGDITAFRPDFAVHGKFGQPCPVCGKPVQRICYAENEANYCAQCQNGGKILADRAMSRLLKDDRPKRLSP
jgi:formamidopyrimidine-DNA glycosylase